MTRTFYLSLCVVNEFLPFRLAVETRNVVVLSPELKASILIKPLLVLI